MLVQSLHFRFDLIYVHAHGCIDGYSRLRVLKFT